MATPCCNSAGCVVNSQVSCTNWLALSCRPGGRGSRAAAGQVHAVLVHDDDQPARVTQHDPGLLVVAAWVQALGRDLALAGRATAHQRREGRADAQVHEDLVARTRTQPLDLRLALDGPAVVAGEAVAQARRGRPFEGRRGSGHGRLDRCLHRLGHCLRWRFRDRLRHRLGRVPDRSGGGLVRSADLRRRGRRRRRLGRRRRRSARGRGRGGGATTGGGATGWSSRTKLTSMRRGRVSAAPSPSRSGRISPISHRCASVTPMAKAASRCHRVGNMAAARAPRRRYLAVLAATSSRSTSAPGIAPGLRVPSSKNTAGVPLMRACARTPGCGRSRRCRSCP